MPVDEGLRQLADEAGIEPRYSNTSAISIDDQETARALLEALRLQARSTGKSPQVSPCWRKKSGNDLCPLL